MTFPDALVTLDRGHPLLDAVPDDSYVLRRFNPDNAQMADVITVDEGTVPRYRLKTGALTGFSEDGCSVARDDVLVEAEIERDEFIMPKYRAIAEALVGAVREMVHEDADGNVREPFKVVPDAYPESEANPMRWHVAHALITLAEGYRGVAKTTAVGTLARTVFNPLGPI